MKRKAYMSILLALFLIIFLSNAEANSYPSSRSSSSDVEKVIKKVFPSVVRVEVQNGTKRIATGVVIDKKGHVVTTALVSPRDERIVVITSDGEETEAEFLGLDSETHIAVLRVKEKKLVPAAMDKGKELMSGTWIGVVSVSPENTPAATQGIVSSVAEDELRLNVWVFPGWSGSPVITKDGYMVGLLRGIYTDEKPIVFEFREKEYVGSGYVYSRAEAPSSGIALAIPVGVVSEIAAEIIEKGKVERGWLGVYIGQTDRGKVMITQIDEESPAELANLKEGDIILSFDGKSVKDPEMLASEIRKKKPGKDVVLEIERNGKRLKVRVKLGEYPEREVRREFTLKFPRLFPPEPAEPFPPAKPSRRLKLPEWYLEKYEKRKYIGLYLEELTEELSEHFGVKEGTGLMVSRFGDDSPAEKAGLKVGDVIVKADDRRVETIRGLSELIQDKKKGEKIKIEFLRNKRTMRVEVEVKEEERRGLEDYFLMKNWQDYVDLFDDYRREATGY